MDHWFNRSIDLVNGKMGNMGRREYGEIGDGDTGYTERWGYGET